MGVGLGTVLGKETVGCGVETATRPSQLVAWGTVVSPEYDGWVENAGKESSSSGGRGREENETELDGGRCWDA